MQHDYEIIDAHTHVHGTREAAHAFLSVLAANRTVSRSGEPQESGEMMQQGGIKKTLILPWVFGKQVVAQRVEALGPKATPDQKERVKHQVGIQWSAYNQWAVLAGKRFDGRYASLVAIDPVLMGEDWARQEIGKRVAQGALGLKIVPFTMEAFPHDDRMAVVWEEANRRGLPVVSQSGGRVGPNEFAHPMHFEAILKTYPKAKVVLAHIGMGAEEEVARLTVRYPNLYTDTSYWLGLVGKPGGRSLKEAAGLFRSIGTDRVIFGTNYPICDPLEFVQVMLNMPLTESERRQIFSQNYRQVYADAI